MTLQMSWENIFVIGYLLFCTVNIVDYQEIVHCVIFLGLSQKTGCFVP